MIGLFAKSRILMSKIIKKEQLMDLIKNHRGEYTLIDVRNPSETEENLIESANKIPLPQFEEAFRLTDEKFEKTFGFVKPKFDDFVICYCRSGARAQSACDFLAHAGYKNVENYKGSANEWFSK